MGHFFDDSEKAASDMLRMLGPRLNNLDNWRHTVVKYTVEGPIAYAVLNDPMNSNGLTGPVNEALVDLFADLNSRPSVKILVMTAKGRYFCTGGAFGAIQGDEIVSGKPPPRRYKPTTHEEMLKEQTEVNKPMGALMLLMATAPQFKIAAIRGSSFGAGNSIILSFDYIIAPSKRVSFNFKEAARGLASCPSWLGVLAKAGVPRTRRFTLVGAELDVDQAKTMGFVDEIIEGPDDASDARAFQLAIELSKLPEKELINKKTTGPLGHPRKLLDVPLGARGCKAIEGDTPDFLTGVREVLERCGRRGRPAAARLSQEMWVHESVRLKRCGQHVAIIKLKRPEAKNAIDEDMVLGLLDAAVELHHSVGKIRLVCVQADGDFFCSGLDKSLSADDEQLHQMLFLMYMLPMYVLGVVDGQVAGLGVALCCTFDALAVSKKAAMLDFSGLTPDHGGEYVTARIGTEKLKELSGSQAKKSADELLTMQIASYVYDGKKDLDSHIASLCDQASQCAPNAVAQSKSYQQNVGTKAFDKGMLQRIAEHVGNRMVDPEFLDSITAVADPTHKPAYRKTEDNMVLAPHTKAKYPPNDAAARFEAALDKGEDSGDVRLGIMGGSMGALKVRTEQWSTY